MGYTVEKSVKIWDDVGGEHIYVGPDKDGLDLVEIRYHDANEKKLQEVTMTIEQAVLVAKSILEMYGSQE